MFYASKYLIILRFVSILSTLIGSLTMSYPTMASIEKYIHFNILSLKICQGIAFAAYCSIFICKPDYFIHEENNVNPEQTTQNLVYTVCDRGYQSTSSHERAEDDFVDRGKDDKSNE